MVKRKKTAKTIISPRKKVTPPDQWEKYLHQVGYSPLTVRGYTRDLTLFIQWLEETRGEKFSLKAITPTDLRDYKSFLMTVKAAKPATVNRRLIAVSRFCSWVKSKGLISDNPVEGIKLLETQRLAPKSLSRQEQRALLRAAEKNGNQRDLAILHLLLGCGLRLSELTNLRRSDIEISPREGRVHVRMGKGMKARDVPLDNDVRKALREYFASYKGKDDDPLFFGQERKGQRPPLKPNGVWEIVRKYAYQAKLEHCSPHTLRHTFGKNLVDRGVPLDQVAILLGHESLDTTKIYTQPTWADLQKAVEATAISGG